MAEPYDLAIVGGGPAGQGAAIALSGLGLSIAVIDEQRRPGGQILRQPPEDFAVLKWLSGSDYLWLKHQVEEFGRLDGVTWIGRYGVIEVARQAHGFSLLIEGPKDVRVMAARRVLIATGCQDLAVPLPGWTLPGVYAAGGIQAFAKSQQIIPGERVVLAGTHPLQLLIGSQIVQAGGRVEAILFAQPLSSIMRVLVARSTVATRYGGTVRLAASALLRLRLAGTQVVFGEALTMIEGEDGVTGVRTDKDRHIDCDTVGLNYGFVPQSALPRMAGASTRSAGVAGGWATLHDAWMESSVPGLYVAGDITGVAGAPAARAEGVLAGLGVARDLGVIDPAQAERRAAPVRSLHKRLIAFADLLDAVADPSAYFPVMTGATSVCRCEDVCYADLREAIGSANSVKLATRCGMGPCQGRNCEPTLLRLLAANGRTGDPGFTQRFPARPVHLADLADFA